MGIALFFLLGWWLRDLSHVKALRWPAAIISLALLALNLFAAREVFGAKNWLTIAGFSLQPSELIKVAFIYVGATSINRMFRSKSILLFIAFSAICVGGLALMGDFGSALIFFATFLVIAFMRSGSIATVLLAVASAAMAGTLVLSIKPHVAQRFATWGHVWEDVSGAGFQQTRALSAAASGGLFGLGAGKWRVIRTVVLPGCVDGVITGCILSVGRILGESAALLFTAGFAHALNGIWRGLHSAGATLTVALYVYAKEQGEFGVAFAIAAILMVLALLINLAASLVSRYFRRKNAL